VLNARMDIARISSMVQEAVAQSRQLMAEVDAILNRR
jgi:hypothetical protein